LAAVTLAAAATLAAQAPAPRPVAAPAKPAAKPWTARTPDGQPDLQGVWTNATLTPFERNPRQADKAFLTEEEASQLEQQASARAAASDTPGRTAAMPIGYRSLDSVIKRASAEGVMVYAVSVTTAGTLGGNTGGGALAKLSKETGTQYQRLGNYSEVKAVFRSIADELHLQYLLGFVPTATDGKPHAIDVKVKRAGVTVLARKSHIAEKK
jgi:hypothetical protein